MAYGSIVMKTKEKYVKATFTITGDHKVSFLFYLSTTSNDMAARDFFKDVLQIT